MKLHYGFVLAYDNFHKSTKMSFTLEKLFSGYFALFVYVCVSVCMCRERVPIDKTAFRPNYLLRKS